MTRDPAPTPPDSLSPSAGYTILCLTALTGVVFVLMENDREMMWILLLAGLGAIGVLARWRAAPPLLVLGLAVLELYHRAVEFNHYRRFDWASTLFTNVILSAAVLMYCAGQYRLSSLKHSVFPVDTRRRPVPKSRGSAPSKSGQPRSAHLPQPWEPPVLAITAVGWAVAVSLFWLVLSVVPAPLDIRRGLWRGLLLIFSVGLATAAAGAVVSYLSWVKATPAEHLMFLQDQAWRETRREQNQINRWLTWAGLRRRRRKEET
jgi:hypothetical protein